MKKSGFKTIYYKGKPTKYGINKKGVVVNLKTFHVMKQNLNVNGYLSVRLSFTKYHRTEVLVHRLLAECFIPNPKNKKQIHHIDGNKLNNDLKNLMWVTAEEHKILHENDDNHPFSKGSKHPNAILSEKDVKKICKYMQNNKYSQHELAVMFNVKDCVIHEIKSGNNWKHITSKYDFSKYNKADWKSASEETVRNICEDIMTNKYTAKEISKRNGVKVDVVQRIRRGESFKDIVSEYDLSINTTIRKSNKQLNSEIHKLISDDKTNSEIINILSLENSPKIQMRIIRQRNKIKTL